MADTSYTLINTASGGDTFGSWVTKTNDLITDIKTIIVTTDQGAGTGTTTGNAHIEGVFSSNTIVIGTALRGGTTAVPASLAITSDVVFSGTTVTSTANVAVTGNMSVSTGKTLSVAGTTALTGAFSVNAPSTTLSTSTQATNITTTANTTITANTFVANTNVVIPNGFTITANGVNISNLNATNLASGTVADARIPTNIVRNTITLTAGTGLTGGGDLSASRTVSANGAILAFLANTQTFSGTNTFSTLRFSGDALPTVTNVTNLGSATFKFLNVYATTFNGTATSAQYADLAEKYLADDEYDIGTVIAIGGDAEVTAANEDNAHAVIGVVSENPAYLMNSSQTGGTAIALKGRVPVKVIGEVQKGDRLTPSSTPGKAYANNAKSVWSFGIALESGNTVVEAIIL